MPQPLSAAGCEVLRCQQSDGAWRDPRDPPGRWGRRSSCVGVDEAGATRREMVRGSGSGSECCGGVWKRIFYVNIRCARGESIKHTWYSRC